MHEFNFDDFKEAIDSQKDALLRIKEEEIQKAIVIGEDITMLREERLAILAAGLEVTNGDRNHLISQWPTIAGFVLPAPLR